MDTCDAWDKDPTVRSGQYKKKDETHLDDKGGPLGRTITWTLQTQIWR